MPWSTDIRALEAASGDAATPTGCREPRCSSRPLTVRSSQESCASSSHSMSMKSFTRRSRASSNGSSIRNWVQERASRGPPPIPESLKCGICGQVFTDPVCICDGTAYDRCCIEEWFARGHKVSPVTRQELETQELRTNKALQAAVDDYLRLRETGEKEQKQWVEFVGELQCRMVRKLDQKSQQVNALKSALLTSRRNPSVSAPGMRPSVTEHGDLSAADRAASDNPSTSSPSTEEHLSEQNEDRSLPSAPQGSPLADAPQGSPLPGAPQGSPVAFGSGKAPRPIRSSGQGDDGHKHVGLLGRLKAGSWKGGKA